MRRLLPLLLLLTGALSARAEETRWFHRMLTPSEAERALPEQLRGMDPNAQWEAKPRLAAEYLDAWTAKGYPASRPEDVLSLQNLNREARRFAQAVAAGSDLAFDEGADARFRVRAATTMAALLDQKAVAEAFGAEGVLEIASGLEQLARSREAQQAPADRSRLLFLLADFFEKRLDLEKVLTLNVEAARASPGSTYQAGKAILRTLMGLSVELDAYPVLRTRAKARFDELRALASEYEHRARKAGDAAAIRHAEAAIEKLEDAEAPVALLGTQAPAWTLVEAHGEVKSLEALRGKVVVLDFWATWCTWCIKSFPAIRDLVKDYEGEELVVVGVSPPGEGIAKAVEQHGITWPVVVVPEQEPEAKYGLRAWPHAVVIDRQGRIRHLKSGALLREDEAKVKRFRQVLDRLLKEP